MGVFSQDAESCEGRGVIFRKPVWATVGSLACVDQGLGHLPEFEVEVLGLSLDRLARTLIAQDPT